MGEQREKERQSVTAQASAGLKKLKRLSLDSVEFHVIKRMVLNFYINFKVVPTHKKLVPIIKEKIKRVSKMYCDYIIPILIYPSLTESYLVKYYLSIQQ
jgi:sulfur relay (sulfurtransferase) DsrC/TusE family protein